MANTYDDFMNEIDYRTFMNIINDIPSCIFFKDTNLKYLFSSHYWDQLLDTDIIGKTDLEIRKDQDNAMIAMETDRNIIRTGIGCKYVIKSDIEGKTSFLELTKEPVTDDDGNVIGIVGLINNITEKTLLEQKLAASYDDLKVTLDKVEKMNASQKMFTASMNHELRSPLNGIIGLLQILLDDKDLNETQYNYVYNAHQSSMMLLDIVNDLLDYAKMETDQFSIRKEAFDLRDIISNIKQTSEKTAEAKGLIFKVHMAENADYKFLGDDLRVRQIIHNIVSNGIKYTDKGSVELSISYEDGKLTIKCSDTGQGISEESQKVLFNPFVRFNENKNKLIQGTGLGLSIVKKIIDKMDGEITVSSKLNEGTTFTIVLPMEVFDKTVGYADNKKISSTEEIDFNTSVDFSHLNVLCVDDTQVNLSVFAGLLKKTNIQLDKAYSGEQGINFANKNRYDIIFMDHQMPQMDGVEAFRIIRESSKYNKKTPVVVLTANVGKEFEKQYKEIGFDDYLSKPVLKEQLIAMIQSLTSE